MSAEHFLQSDAYWRDVERYTRAIRTTAESVGHILFGFGRVVRTSCWEGEGRNVKGVIWVENRISFFGKPLSEMLQLSMFTDPKNATQATCLNYEIGKRDLVVEKYQYELPSPENGFRSLERNLELMSTDTPEPHDYDALHYELHHGATIKLDIPYNENI